jgi:hypothetical protein
MRTFSLLMILLCAAPYASAEVTATAVDAGDAAAAQSLSVKTFQFKHKSAEKAIAIVKPLLSSDGSIALQTASLVITDRAENIKAVTAALAQFDRPAQSFHLNVRLIAASRVDAAHAPRVPDDLKEVAAKLALLRYNAFESLGDVRVEAKEGDPGLLDMTGYRADFRLGEYDAASDTVRVEDFRLSRLQGDQLAQLVKTTLNLKIGQVFILGATKSAQSERALLVVVTANR